MAFRCLFLWGMTCLLLGVVQGQDSPLEDPVPIQRLLLPPARLPAEMARLKQGVLVQLPRSEFEARVQRAAQAVRDVTSGPRLVQAIYTAEVQGPYLVGGNGRWNILHNGPVPLIFSLPSFNLALGKIRSTAGPEVLLGEIDGKNLGLVVDKSAEYFFDWSARGQVTPGGYFFDLKFPTAQVASLELTTPADHLVSLPKGGGSLTAAGTGPGGKRLWRLGLTGQSHVELLVRKIADPERQPPLVQSQMLGRLNVYPDQAMAEFDVNLEVMHTALEKIVFLCDPGLEPYEVTARNVELRGWELRPGAVAKGGKQPQAAPLELVVTLREPFQGSIQGLRVRALAAKPGEGAWRIPGLWQRGARSRGETLRLQIHPEVRLGPWDAGRFRLSGAALDGDGNQVLTLNDLATDYQGDQRPVLNFSPPTVDPVVVQKSRWQLENDQAFFRSEVQLPPGWNQSQLTLRLPEGQSWKWKVTGATAEPAGALVSWGTDGKFVHLVLAPSAGKNPVRLQVALASPWPDVPLPALLNLPDLAPVPAQRRRQVMSIAVGSAWQAKLVSALRAGPPLDRPEHDEPQTLFFLANGEAPLAGQLQLFPRPVRSQLTCRQEVLLGSEPGSVRVRLEMDQALRGGHSLDFFVMGQNEAHWSLVRAPAGMVEATLHRQPVQESLPGLLQLGSGGGLPGLCHLALRPPLHAWKLTWARSISDKLVAEMSLPLPFLGQGIGRHCDIPLLVFPGAEAVSYEVRISSPGPGQASKSQVSAQGGPSGWLENLRPPIVPLAWDRLGSRWSVAYSPKQPFHQAGEVYDQAEWTTYLEPAHAALHHFGLRLQAPQRTRLPIVLPPGAERLVSVRLNGRWLSGATWQPKDQHVLVEVPVPGDAHSHWLELVYATRLDWRGWPARAQLVEQAPQLPRTPLTLARRLRLHPALAPLHQDNLVCREVLPQEINVDRAKKWWQWGQEFLDEIWPSEEGEALKNQSLELLHAEAALRTSLTQETLLGDALRGLVHQLGKEHMAVVVDRKGLLASGWQASKPLGWAFQASPGKPIWDNLGLALVPFPAGALLTTRQVLVRWSKAGAMDVRSLAPALDQAVRQGRDELNRFYSLPVWLGEGADSPEKTRSKDAGLSGEAVGDFSHWLEWSPRPGARAESYLFIQSQEVMILAWILSGAILVFLMVGWRRWGRLWSGRLALVLLGTLIMIRAALPHALQEVTEPTLVVLGLVLALMYGIVLGGKMRSGRTQAYSTGKMPRLAGPLTLILVSLSWPGRSLPQAPPVAEPAVVYLVQGESGASTMVLAPQALLQKLAELTQRPSLPSKGVVWLAATYQGQVRGPMAQLTATLDFYSWSDQTRAHAAFSGVELGEGAFLDGAPAFPVADLKGGFSFPVRGKGMHRLLLPLSCRVATVADHQELRFGLPRCPRSQVDLAVDSQALSAHMVQGQGFEKLRPGTGKGSTFLEVHLGREANFFMRWQTKQTSVPSQEVEVRELYRWDLRPGSLGLQGLLQCQARRGPVSSLDLMLPAGLEVRQAEVLVPGSSALNALQRWTIQGKEGNRQLHLELANPIAGNFLVHLALAPQISHSGGALVLRLPYPLRAKTVAGFLGYWVENRETADAFQNLGVTNLTPEEFGKAWSAAQGQDTSPSVSRAFSFGRTAPDSILTVSFLPPKFQASSVTSWRLEGQGIQFQNTMDLSGLEELALVEIPIPPGLAVDDVIGSHIHRWHLAGGLVQVWLDQARKQTQVQVQGRTTAIPAMTLEKAGRLLLPQMLPRHAKLVGGRWTIHAAPGIVWEVERAKSLEKSPGQEKPGLAAFRLEKADAELVLLVRRQPLPWHVDLATLARGRDHVDVEIFGRARQPEGNGGTLTFLLADKSLETPGMEVEGSLPVQKVHAPGEWQWRVTIPAGAPQPVRWRLRGKIRGGPGLAWKFPPLRVQGAELGQEWFIWEGPPLSIKEERGVTLAKDLSAFQEAWPGEFQGLSATALVWKAAKSDWVLAGAIEPQDREPKTQFLWSEHQLTLADPHQWSHQVRYELLALRATTLEVRMPEGAQVQTMTMDGLAQSLETQKKNKVTLSLPGSDQIRSLVVTWRQPRENFLRPETSVPQLAGVVPGESWHELVVSAGLYEPTFPAALAPWQVSFMKAKGYLQAATVLGPRARDAQGTWFKGLAALHQRCLRDLQAAESWLQYSALPDVERLRGLQELDNVRQRMREMAQRNGYATQLATWEKIKQPPVAPLLDLPGAGMPMYFQKPAFGDPELVLNPQLARQPWVLPRTTLLVILAALMLATYFPGSIRLARRTWPEQVALIALIGVLVWGMSLVGLVLLVAALLGRMILVVQWARAWGNTGGPATQSSVP